MTHYIIQSTATNTYYEADHFGWSWQQSERMACNLTKEQAQQASDWLTAQGYPNTILEK